METTEQVGVPVEPEQSSNVMSYPQAGLVIIAYVLLNFIWLAVVWSR